jgi:hypothetical protein
MNVAIKKLTTKSRRTQRFFVKLCDLVPLWHLYFNLEEDVHNTLLDVPQRPTLQ